MTAKNTLLVIRTVLKQPAYAMLCLAMILLMIIVSTYMLNLPLIHSTITAPWALRAKMALLLNLLGGVVTNNTVPALVLLLLTSSLAGLNVALAVYRWKEQRALHLAQTSASTTGMGVGFLAAGCSSCGISLLAMLGLTGVIAFLPFQGLELSMLSVVILSVTLIWLTKNHHGTCMPRAKKSAN